MDNGVGFDIEIAKEKSVEKSSTGLMNIAGRAKFVQADLMIESTIGQGTKIEIAIPNTQKE
jgi:signal transduction histidine kinase